MLVYFWHCSTLFENGWQPDLHECSSSKGYWTYGTVVCMGKLPHTYYGGSYKTLTHAPVVRQHAPTRKYHCTLPINPSHIASIPHTSSFQLHISLVEWNDTTREPHIQQPLDRHLRLHQIQAPRRIPPRGEEADSLGPQLGKAARVIRGIFPPYNQDQASLPVTGPTRKSSQINVFNPLTLRRWNFLLNFSTPVFNMWIIQEPKKVALWNKRHSEEEKTENVQHV